MKLTNKQELFIQYYMISLNATSSYKKAGYAVKNDEVAAVMASRLLRNDKVKATIDLKLSERAIENKVTAEYVISSLKLIADRCMQQEPVYDKKGEPTGEFKFDSSGANRSLELLGKHLVLFTDKVETSGETTVNNKVDLTGFSVEQLKEMLKE